MVDKNYYFVYDKSYKPFLVEIYKKSIKVMKQEKISTDDSGIIETYTKIILELENFEKVFIGYDECDSEYSIGNSILINYRNLEYIFIGFIILEFIAKSKIIDFHSIIGPRYNIYPWALDDQGNVYLTDIPSFMKCTKEEIENFQDYTLSDLVYFKELTKIENIQHNHAPIRDKLKRCQDFPEIKEKKEILFMKKGHPLFLDKVYYSLKSKNIHSRIEIYDENIPGNDYVTCYCDLNKQ